MDNFHKGVSTMNGRYLLSREETENHLAKFLKCKSETLWLKYKFADLENLLDRYKVLFRMILEAARSENHSFWKFTWKKIETLALQRNILTEYNYEVIKSTLLNFENHRLLIMRLAKKYLDNGDYLNMIKNVFNCAFFCHNNLLYGIVYNNVGCLNFLWSYVTDEEKTLILGSFGAPSKKLFGILSVKYLLEDKVILQYLKHNSVLLIECSNSFFLSDKKSEDTLVGFLNSPNIKEPQKKLDSLWKNTFESSTVEEQRKVLLRLFLHKIKTHRNMISEWAWQKSLDLNEQIFLLKGANFSAIKHVLVDCQSSTLKEFLGKAVNYLLRTELVEILKEGVEYIVYCHGRVFDEDVENNSKSLQVALNEFGKSLSLQVLSSLKESTRIKHNLMLKYERLQEVPENWFAYHVLLAKEAEIQFGKFLKTIKGHKKNSKESLEREWNHRGMQNLDSQARYSALFRVFIFSVGFTTDVILFWILSKIEQAGIVVKEVLKEQNYHFIKTVMDISNEKILKRTLKFAAGYLDKEDMDCMYQEAYMHALKWHGNFICGEVWNSTSSLETLKKISIQDQWESIFGFPEPKYDDDEDSDDSSDGGTDETLADGGTGETLADGETDDCRDIKRIRLM